VIDPAGLPALTAGDTLTLSRSGDAVILSYAAAPVPEPATVLGFAAAAVGLGGLARRRLVRRGNAPEPR
jgi:hypothetical protein